MHYCPRRIGAHDRILTAHSPHVITGGVTPFEPPLHSRERIVGPGFHAQVHELVSSVPVGRVTTYGDVAEALGSRSVARHVGYALAALPEGSEVPWWRVVAAGGRLSLASGAAKQARRLRREGLTVTKLQLREFEAHRHVWEH